MGAPVAGALLRRAGYAEDPPDQASVPDYAQLAEALGAAGFMVDSEDDLDATLEAALDCQAAAPRSSTRGSIPTRTAYPMVPAGAASVDTIEPPRRGRRRAPRGSSDVSPSFAFGSLPWGKPCFLHASPFFLASVGEPPGSPAPHWWLMGRKAAHEPPHRSRSSFENKPRCARARLPDVRAARLQHPEPRRGADRAASHLAPDAARRLLRALARADREADAQARQRAASRGAAARGVGRA